MIIHMILTNFKGIPSIYYPDFESDCVSTSVIKTIKDWLDNTDELMMILMFDDIDFQYIKYWDFDWKYLMDNLPHDWDSILLGFDDVIGAIPFYLHPISSSHSAGPTLINRRYAEKLVRLHFCDGKYNFYRKISNKFWKTDSGFVSYNYFLNHCGMSYALPLFPKHGSMTQDLYYLFWTKVYKNVPREVFFSYSAGCDLDDLILTKGIKRIKLPKYV